MRIIFALEIASKDALNYSQFIIKAYLCNPNGKGMLKQVVVDKVMARQLWKLGFREPTLSYYNLNGELQTADGEELILKDYNAPKQTRGRGARCFSAPTLSAVQDWLRRKKHLELLICRDTFFQNTGDYYCRLIRLSDGLSRDTHPRKSYDQALMDGIKQAIKQAIKLLS